MPDIRAARGSRATAGARAARSGSAARRAAFARRATRSGSGDEAGQGRGNGQKGKAFRMGHRCSAPSEVLAMGIQVVAVRWRGSQKANRDEAA